MALRSSSRKGTKGRSSRAESNVHGSEGTHVPERRSLERLGLGSLIGAEASDTANFKAAHEYPGAVSSDLPNIVSSIEKKFNDGVYDAEVMPLVREYLDEIETLAKAQNKRDAIIKQRVDDIKEANEKASSAVSEAREERASEIRALYEETQQRWADEEALKEEGNKERRFAKSRRKVGRARLKARREEVKEEQRIQRHEDRLAQYQIDADRKMAQRQRREAEKEVAHDRKVAARAQRASKGALHASDALKEYVDADRQAVDEKLAELENGATVAGKQKARVIKDVDEADSQRRAVEAAERDAESARRALKREAEADEDKIQAEGSTSGDTQSGNSSKGIFSRLLGARRDSRNSDTSDSNEGEPEQKRSLSSEVDVKEDANEYANASAGTENLGNVAESADESKSTTVAPEFSFLAEEDVDAPADAVSDSSAISGVDKASDSGSLFSPNIAFPEVVDQANEEEEEDGEGAYEGAEDQSSGW